MMENTPMEDDYFNEVCGNCGLTFGCHHGGTYNEDPPVPPRDYCPGHEGYMDWENGPGTTFKPTGKYAERVYGKPAKGGKE